MDEESWTLNKMACNGGSLHLALGSEGLKKKKKNPQEENLKIYVKAKQIFVTCENLTRNYTSYGLLIYEL